MKSSCHAMHAPHSYTREDVVEINCHSGYAVLQHILHLTLQQGARLANPGEFTLRAFLSGRLDLTQAEAVLEIIQARSDAGLKVAAAHLAGGLGQKITRLRESLLDLLARVEADLDFGEELPELNYPELILSLQALEAEIAVLVPILCPGPPAPGRAAGCPGRPPQCGQIQSVKPVAANRPGPGH